MFVQPRLSVSSFRFFLITLIVACGLLVPSAEAQIQHGGTPYSFENDVPGGVPVETMRPVDVEALLAEDEADRQSGQPIPPRFGTALNVNLGINNSGRWTELPDGSRLWRLRIASQGAYSINLIFNRYELPEGGKLFIYNQDQTAVLGAFTAANNKEHGKFSTVPISGSVITLEYYEPEAVRGQGDIRLSKVIHAYRSGFSRDEPPNGSPLAKAYGDAAGCHNNVNCSKWSDWDDEKRSAAMVLLDDNTRHCSGALLNSPVGYPQEPFFLTAYHCIDVNYSNGLSSGEISEAESWIFMFKYESPSCSNQNGPTSFTVSGSTFRAGYYYSDFALVELSSDPPAHWEVYHAGWTANSSPSRSEVVGIHHPRGDIKKISEDNSAPSSTTYSGRDVWYVQDWSDGDTQGGSSGSPLFNPIDRIIGQDFAGDTNQGTTVCQDKGTYYGKFSTSWDYRSSSSEQLKHWLDPNNSTNGVYDGGYPPFRVEKIVGTSQATEGEERSWTVYAGGKDPDADINFKWYYRVSGGSWTLVQNVTKSGNQDTYTRVIGDSDFELEARTERLNDVSSKTISVSVSTNGEGGEALRRAEPADRPTPSQFGLGQNYPNPSRETVTIPFEVPENRHVTIVVYDALGREVIRPLDRSMPLGFHEIQVDVSSMRSGVYLYEMQADDFAESRRMTVVR